MLFDFKVDYTTNMSDHLPNLASLFLDLKPGLQSKDREFSQMKQFVWKEDEYFDFQKAMYYSPNLSFKIKDLNADSIYNNLIKNTQDYTKKSRNEMGDCLSHVFNFD